MKHAIAIVFAGLLAVSLGCAIGQPAFLDQIIAEHEATLNDVTNESPSRLEIWQYEYQGSTVFYLPYARTHCCDAFSMVYDSDGKLICMPEGGITGEGDGRCPGFSTSRSRGELVYGGNESDRPVAQ